jgi:hypothetical protein
MTVSCHGVILRGESRKTYFVRGESKRNFFLGGNPEVTYFAGGKHLFTLLKIIKNYIF